MKRAFLRSAYIAYMFTLDGCVNVGERHTTADARVNVGEPHTAADGGVNVGERHTTADGYVYADARHTIDSETSWRNIYAGNPNLAGIEVWQYPREGNVYESRDRYTGRHPAQITYVFWDGRAYDVLYSPNGEIEDQGWWQHIKIEPGSDEWGYVDFSYGSDPKFLKHPDPRKKGGA